MKVWDVMHEAGKKDCAVYVSPDGMEHVCRGGSLYVRSDDGIEQIILTKGDLTGDWTRKEDPWEECTAQEAWDACRAGDEAEAMVTDGSWARVSAEENGYINWVEGLYIPTLPSRKFRKRKKVQS